MKRLLLISIFSFLVISPLTLFAQVPSVPEDYSFRSSRDYLVNQDLAVSCILWMQANHPEDFEPRRRQMNQFVTQWMTGNPNLKLKLDEPFYNSLSKEKDYAYIEELGKVYLYSKALHLLSHPGSKDNTSVKLAATDKMLELYGIILASDPNATSKTMEKMLKLKEKDKLKEHIDKVSS